MKSKLFVKIALIIIVSLLSTNAITVVVTSAIMEKTFIYSFALSNNKILDQIMLDFVELNTQIVAFSNAYRQNAALKQYFTNSMEEDEKEVFKLFYNIRMYLKSVEATSEFPWFNIATLGRNGRTFVSSGDGLSMTDLELRQHPITLESIKSPTTLIYRYNEIGFTGYTKNTPSIIAVKQLIDPYMPHSFGTIYISIEENDFSKIYSGFTTRGNDMMILDQEGKIVSSNDKRLVGCKDEVLLEWAQEIIASNESYRIYEDEVERDIMIARYLPIYDMYLVNKVQMNLILEKFLEIRTIIFTGCFFVTFVTVMLVFFVTRRITKPLTKLVNHMREITDGHFEKVAHIDGSYEVQELQEGYNIMIDEINHYIKTLMKEQKQRRKAEIEALQMQINPHFLYNTLATIKYLSWQGNVQAVTSTINALIALLQKTISKESETITLEQEIKNLQHYVTINQARYGDGIRVDYHVSEECVDSKVPKLILQPFLENAFFHAYQEKKEGIIRVFVSKKNNKLFCEIIDDGDGISEESQKDLFRKRGNKEHFSGIGINNVNERIRMIFGEDYGVEINSTLGIGTTVIINMPYGGIGGAE